MKRRILAINDYYRPGFRGGTIQSLANIVDRLGDQYDFWIVTSDRDVTQSSPYDGVVRNSWTQVGRSSVYYAEPGKLSFSMLRRLVRQVGPDLLFVMSPFSRVSIRLLLLRRTGQLPNSPVLLSPEGEFDRGALAQKALKKRAYLRWAALTGLFQSLSWRATSQEEAEHIRRTVSDDARVFIAQCLPPAGPERAAGPCVYKCKTPGRVEFIYVSRVTPKKNLRFAIDRLAALRRPVSLDVVGPIEDRDYWRECVSAAETGGPFIRLRHCGEVPPDRVASELDQRHFFLMPSFGENFGYAISEALSRGRPVLLSDRTPWRGLAARNAGWDLSLENVAGWRQALTQCVEMDDTEYQKWVSGAAAFAQEVMDPKAGEAAVIHAFDATMAAAQSGQRPLRPALPERT